MSTRNVVERPHIPLFELFTLDELHKRLGYSFDYLIELMNGRKPLNERFRLNASGILNRPEAELFGTQVEDTEAPVGAGDPR